ncbi:MAG TPA: LuxR C-terminal-related transcriptional regulator, partial [Candidatus Methylomirabilis sp.]|nr:LuxR C-terminal-related transcriptional regulator [Candidatus Methylomirabilis sp.]
LGGASETLQLAERVVVKTKVDPFVQCWLEDSRVRLWALEEDDSAIARWMETCGLSVAGPFSYHYDLHHANLARAQVALGVHTGSPALLDQAVDLLSRLVEAADRAGWVQEKIHILSLRALAENALGRAEEAVEDTLQALVLAEPGGYIRLFVDEGEVCWVLISRIAVMAEKGRLLASGQHGLGSVPDRFTSYLEGLVRAIETEKGGRLQASRRAEGAPGIGSPQGTWLIPSPVPRDLLTGRELEVLRLIEAGCSNQEIALKLVIALGTVKRHTVNIFNKLDVTSRTQAVARARELGLI